MDRVVELLLDLRNGAQPRPAALPAGLAPRTEADAYQIQLQVLKRLGTHVGGWKASMPDASQGWSAPIASTNLLRAGAALAPPALLTRRSPRIGIEPEIAFTLARALPAGPVYTREQVLQAVGGAHAALELCVCRLADFDAAPLLDRLADGLMNEALALSAPSTSWQALELKSLPLRVLVDGEVVHQGLGGHPLNDPVLPLVWMANHLSRRGIGLQAGDVVTTGSCAGIRWLPPGRRVQAEFSPLGRVDVQL
jgi:2-keto-4-pentenoate hydratase